MPWLARSSDREVQAWPAQGKSVVQLQYHHMMILQQSSQYCQEGGGHTMQPADVEWQITEFQPVLVNGLHHLGGSCEACCRS